MEVDLQVYLGSMSRDVHNCTHWLRPRNSPPLPLRLDSYFEGAFGQQRKATSLVNPLYKSLTNT